MKIFVHAHNSTNKHTKILNQVLMATMSFTEPQGIQGIKVTYTHTHLNTHIFPLATTFSLHWCCHLFIYLFILRNSTFGQLCAFLTPPFHFSVSLRRPVLSACLSVQPILQQAENQISTFKPLEYICSAVIMLIQTKNVCMLWCSVQHRWWPEMPNSCFFWTL